MNLNLVNIVILTLVILVIWVPWLWRYKIKPYFANKVLQAKLKQNPQWKVLLDTERFLYDLYKRVNAKAISKKERKRLAIEDDAFVYGEIEFLPFYTILEKTKPKTSDVFYDLGSGAGKAVFTAASFFDMNKACGIELLPALYHLSHQQIRKAQPMAKACQRKLSTIEFIQEDFLQFDISDGDIIFINATCLSFSSWEKILDKLMHLKIGSRVIVTSKKIQHDAFEIVSQSFELMSWGLNSVNIYRKVL